MSLLKEIETSASVAWSPIGSKSNLLALGSKEGTGVGFDNYGGELQVVSLDFGNTSPNASVLGSVKTSSRFMSLGWSDVAKHPSCSYGLIAGGMSDGTVNLWDPAKVIKNEGPAAQVARIQRHKGAVNALHFNPHKDSSHLLASGGSDNEIYIMSIEQLAQPAVFSPGGPNTVKHNAEITCLAWNTQVSYILASGSQNGSTMIWDLKQKKPWCELKDPQRGIVSAIAWNPNEGLHIITASEDDQRPVLRLWDLRSSTSTPLAELNNHTAGILSVSWCPSDPGLLMSCAKDNRTLLWDLYTGQPIYEVPSRSTSQPTAAGSGQFFAGSAGGQRRFNVQWSPKIPAVVSASTFDGKVQVWGMAGAGSTTATRAPKWYQRPVTASFGFGGKLVTVTNSRHVNIRRIETEPDLVTNAVNLEAALGERNFHMYCDKKIKTCATEHERNVWAFMQILFEKDARQQLLLHLGFDAQAVAAEAAKYSAKTGTTEATPSSNLLDTVDGITQGTSFETKELTAPATPFEAAEGTTPASSLELTGSQSPKGFGLDDDDVFSSGFGPVQDKTSSLDATLGDVTKAISEVSLKEEVAVTSSAGPTPVYSAESENMIKRALLVGDFEAAVDCCLRNNQLADALLLATCGGPELWTRTQEAYFSRQTRPFMKIVSAIIKSELSTLVAESDLSQWQETLAILSTYGKSEEFPALCDALAGRLEAAGDVRSATLCYMCAVNVEKTVGIWVREATLKSKDIGETLALLELVEKVSVFRQALEPPEQDMGTEVASQFSAYASLLASQGLLDIASRYVVYNDMSCAILRDRIFHAAPPPGVAPPPSPFERHEVIAGQQQPVQQQQRRVAHPQQSRQQPTGNFGTPSPFPQQHQQPTAAHHGYGGQPQQAANASYPNPQQSYPTAQNAQYQAPSAFPGQQNNAVPGPKMGPYPGQTGQGYGAPAQPAAYGGQATQPSPGYPGQTNQPNPAFPGQTSQSTPAFAAQTGQINPVYPGQSSQPTPSYPGQTGQTTPSYPGQTGHNFAAQNQATPSFPGQTSTPSFPSGSPSPAFPAPSAQPVHNFAPSPTGFGSSIPSAAPGVPGLNPVEAALKQTAKVSKTPLNMQQQRSDGFVTSVGNKDLALKYGNTPSTPLSPVTTGAPEAAAGQVIPGSTESVAPENMPIVHSFNDIVGLLENNSDLNIAERRQLAEVVKSKEILFTKLNSNDLSPHVLAKLHEMIQCFSARDFRGAQQLHVALTTTDWAEHKDWLRGVKSMINISQKRLN